MPDTPPTASRFRQLADVLKALHDELGRSAVAFLGGDLEPTSGPPPIPMGDDGLDRAFGGAGLPRQRMIEIGGRPAVGKTSLAFDLIARAQRAGGVAAYLDVEHGFLIERARELGVNTDTLIVARPGTAEEALTVAEELVRASAADIVVLDSIAALVPEAELDGRVGEAPAGLQARLVGQALRRLTVALRTSTTAVVLINHLRPGLDGELTSPGGSALPFFTAVRLHLEGGALVDGHLSVVLRVVKSKLGPIGQQVRLALPAGAPASVPLDDSAPRAPAPQGGAGVTELPRAA
jgi:recombination protein RecA